MDLGSSYFPCSRPHADDLQKVSLILILTHKKRMHPCTPDAPVGTGNILAQCILGSILHATTLYNEAVRGLSELIYVSHTERCSMYQRHAGI